MPQKEAGRITEPPVWVPTASGVMPAATAAADPEDEPPGVCSGLTGLRVLPGCRNASSVLTVLPRMMAPAARSLPTIIASRSGTRPASTTVPLAVGMPLVSMTSFNATGTPCNGPIGRPERRCASAISAWRMAKAGSTHSNAWISPSSAAILSRHAFT